MLQAILLSIYKYRCQYENANNTNLYIVSRLIKVKIHISALILFTRSLFRSPLFFSLTFATEILTNGCLADIGVVIPGGCNCYCSD